MIYLEDRSIISITGKDKLEFLQGMVTNDLNKLSNDNHIFCCLLSPTGKFLADFFIYQYGEMYLLDINKNMVKEILLKFKLYKLKREVFFVETDYNVFLDIDKTNLATNCVIDKNGNMIANDLRKNDFGTRIIDLKEVIKNDFSKDLQDYHQYRINNCVIDGYYDLEKDKSFILEFGYQNMNGVDFNKGCYVGQEVITRMMRRGVIRKAPYIVKGAIDSSLIGSDILVEEKKVGKLCFAIDEIGIALCKIEYVENGAKITINGLISSLLVP